MTDTPDSTFDPALDPDTVPGGIRSFDELPLPDLTDTLPVPPARCPKCRAIRQRMDGEFGSGAVFDNGTPQGHPRFVSTGVFPVSAIQAWSLLIERLSFPGSALQPQARYGEHVLVRCACQYVWRELPQDHPRVQAAIETANLRARVPASAEDDETPLDVFAALRVARRSQTAQEMALIHLQELGRALHNAAVRLDEGSTVASGSPERESGSVTCTPLASTRTARARRAPRGRAAHATSE